MLVLTVLFYKHAGCVYYREGYLDVRRGGCLVRIMQKMMPGAVSRVVAGDDASGLRPAAGHSMMSRNFLLDHVSPATRLLEKRRQTFEIQEELEAQKEEFFRQDGASMLDLHKIHTMGQRSRGGGNSDHLI